MKQELTLDEMYENLKNESLESKIEIESALATAKIILSIKKAREDKGLSQRDLAKICGLKQPAIARIESGKNIPQIDTLLKITKALDLEILEDTRKNEINITIKPQSSVKYNLNSNKYKINKVKVGEVSYVC